MGFSSQNSVGALHVHTETFYSFNDAVKGSRPAEANF